MLDDLYVLGLGDYSKDSIEGVRTAVMGDFQLRSMLEKIEGDCPVVAVRKVLKAVDERGRLKKFSARLVQSDIGRLLIPRTESQIYEHATIGELQANLRLVGIFTASDDRGFLRNPLRTAPGLLVTAEAIEETTRFVTAKEAVARSDKLPYAELGFKVGTPETLEVERSRLADLKEDEVLAAKLKKIEEEKKEEVLKKDGFEQVSAAEFSARIEVGLIKDGEMRKQL